MPRISNIPASTLFDEIEFIPFNSEQIEKFVTNFIKLQPAEADEKWSKLETYLEKI